MIKPLLTVFGLLFLSACTSSQAVNAGCDFVEGSVESQRRHNDPSSLQPTVTHIDANIINGIFNALLAPVGRAMSDGQGCAGAEEEPYQIHRLDYAN